MTKLFCLMIPCLLILVFSLSHQLSTCISPSQSSTIEDQTLGPRPRKEIVFSAVKTADAEKTEITQKTQKSKIKVNSIGIPRGDDEEGGLIYSADYRGVTTHPSPLPKHPKP